MMKPNSKSYNNDSSFSYSSQRQQPYRSYQSKSKFCDAERWDHSGFDQLQSEQERFSKFTKTRRDNNELTMAADLIESSATTRDSAVTVDTNTNSAPQKADIVEVPLKQESKPARKEKRPDRQLYSVRQKCTTNGSTNNDEKKRLKEIRIQCSEKLNCSAIEKREEFSPYPQAVKDVLTAFEEKEQFPHEDDKLSISNVSTAMSDPLKNWEEESYVKSELLTKERMDTTADMSQNTHNSDIINNSGSCGTLFELMLETENGTINIRITQNDEDYESLLENLCNVHNFDLKMNLYFKINILQLIKESFIGDSEKIDTLLDKLLDLNYKVLMYESGFGEADDSIAPYIAESKKAETSSIVLDGFVQCA